MTQPLTDRALDHYLIRGGVDGRVRVLARIMWPTTRELLARVRVPEDARCLDVGCGGGDVAIPLARLAPRGRVVGTDIDQVKLELARDEARAAGVGNVEFRHEDVTDPPRQVERFDLVYARSCSPTCPTRPRRWLGSSLDWSLAAGWSSRTSTAWVTSATPNRSLPALRRALHHRRPGTRRRS